MKSVELTANRAEPAATNVADRFIVPFARRRLEESLAALRVGRLTVHLPDASVIDAGDPDAELHATMWIARNAFFRKFALRGDLGAGESYVDGDWRTDDLCRFAELVLLNQAYLPLDSWLSRLANLPNDWLHVRRRNSRRAAGGTSARTTTSATSCSRRSWTPPWPIRARCSSRLMSRWPWRNSESSSAGATPCGLARPIMCSRSAPDGAVLPCMRPAPEAAA